jgi:hypothetical protein
MNGCNMQSKREHLSLKISGLSLIELMIALALGALLTIVVYTVFDMHQRGFQLIVDLNDREDNAQLALNALSDAISMADHWGGVESSRVDVLMGSLSSAPGSCDHHWVLDVSAGLKGLEGASASHLIKGLPAHCLKTQEYIPDSDLLVLRFADSRRYIKEHELDNKRYEKHFFVRAQAGDSALLFQGKQTQQAINRIPDDGYHYNMGYHSSLFFLKPCQVNAVACMENESVLSRLVLRGDRYMQEPLVEGITQMQFEYGVDENDDAEVERYVHADQIANWRTVRSVRIFLLVRTRLKDISQDELGKMYLMNSAESTAEAHYQVDQRGRYYRYKLYRRDVSLRNRI